MKGCQCHNDPKQLAYRLFNPTVTNPQIGYTLCSQLTWSHKFSTQCVEN